MVEVEPHFDIVIQNSVRLGLSHLIQSFVVDLGFLLVFLGSHEPREGVPHRTVVLGLGIVGIWNRRKPVNDAALKFVREQRIVYGSLVFVIEGVPPLQEDTRDDI